MINVKHLVSAMHKSLVPFVTEIQTNQVTEKMTNSKAFWCQAETQLCAINLQQ